jgi:hypothetical protein
MKKVISVDPGELRIEMPANVVHLRKKVEGETQALLLLLLLRRRRRQRRRRLVSLSVTVAVVVVVQIVSKSCRERRRWICWRAT